ncbi:hypothetical protein PO118_16190, partial [Bacteroides thetaiotaomicron]|uniref:hypothetical protein n=1 Tax=Bacteroides thetaiotaomicron TaxID=818 RepID=UPI00232E8435
RFDCIHCRKATTKPQSVKGAFLRMLTPIRTWWKVREHKFPRPYAHAVRSRAEGTYRARGISHANEM